MPSNSRPQPIAKRVSPTKATRSSSKIKSDVSDRMAGNFDYPADVVAEADFVAFLQRDVAAGNILGRGPEMRAPVASLIARFPPVWSGCQCVFQTW